MTPATGTSERMSAEDRKVAVLDAALREFAHSGLAGTSTEAIARRAGISQPYIFRLFPTKKALFVAAVREGFRRVTDAFEDAAGDLTGLEALDAMGRRYGDLLRDRELLLAQLHAYAACDDPDICTAVRESYAALWATVHRISGFDHGELAQFFAGGMLLNVAAAMDLPGLDEKWARSAIEYVCPDGLPR